MGLGMGCLTSRILLQIACSYKCQFWTKVYAFLQGWSLKFKEWLAKYKGYLMYQIPMKILKHHEIPNLIHRTWRFIPQKGAEKLIKDDGWIMQIVKIAILKLRIFSVRYHFRLLAFASTSEYFYCWHREILPKMLRGKWCQVLQKHCSTILRFVLTNHMYIADRLI